MRGKYPEPDQFTIRELLEKPGKKLELRFDGDETCLDHLVKSPDIFRPGLCLTGYTHKFLYDRIQIFGETEITYLNLMDSEERVKSLNFVFSFPVYCCLITKGFEPPVELVDICRNNKVALLRTNGDTTPVIREITGYLSEVFAPRKSIHGSLVDVFGVGVLCTGKSAIGKSESVLGLIERGHRFVADDLVHIKRTGEKLIGAGDNMLGYHMELRGIGVIDVSQLYGIKSVKESQQVNMEVRLEEWTKNLECDRTGLEKNHNEILGLKIPLVILPVLPGRNLTLLLEAAAMTYLLNEKGCNPAEIFNRSLIDRIKERMEEQFDESPDESPDECPEECSQDH